MAALKAFWPEPANCWAIWPAKTATSAAPATPAAMPPAIQRRRPATPSVAASTTPTIRPASRTSRKTMRAAASMGEATCLALVDDDLALGGGCVELAHEAVLTGLQRPDGEAD